MIPLFKVRMSDDVDKFVMPVLMSGYIGQGTKVEEFEDLLWEELKSPVRPITVNSCTSAIDLALELCGVGPDDEVISTPQTCFASQVGAIHRNARIRWADIDPKTGLIDSESVARLVNENTKAIIAVNWAGKFADYKQLKSHGVPVIEDAAHTWDVFLSEKPERGDYVCYSFQAIKFLTTTDGGALITPPNKEHEARLLRWYGLDRTKSESFRCTQNIQAAGFKYHMNDVCASIGIANLSDARNSVQKSRSNAKYLSDNLKDVAFAHVSEYDDSSSYWFFPVVLEEGFDKDSFVSYLEEKGIASSPVHFRNDFYDSTSKFKEGRLDGVDYFSSHQINIPCGWWMTQEDLEYIVETVKNYDKILNHSS